MKRLTFITMALLAIAGRASAQNVISCTEITAKSGQLVELPIELTSQESLTVVGISFTLTLPEGVTVEEDGEDPVYSLVSDRFNPKHFSVYSTKYSDSSWGFRVITGHATDALQGTEGAFMTITLNIADGMAEGSYDVKLTENSLSVRESGSNVETLKINDSTSTLTVSNIVPPLVLDENSSEEIVGGTYPNVILKRTFAEGWNTVCLPFAITNVESFFGSGAKAYEFDGFEDGELCFSEVSGELTASIPYVVYVPAAITEGIELTDISIDEDDTEGYYVYFSKKYYFRGTYAPVAPGEWTKKADTDDIYGVTIDGRILKAGPEASIKGFRAYFDLPAGAAVKGLVFEDGDATGISSRITSPEEGQVYNLAGQRLNKIQKGVNITNGKKILK